MIQNVYARLRKRLNRLHVPLPDSKNLQHLLRLIYNEEEAEWAASFPALPKPEAWFAKKWRVSAEEATVRLEHLARRGIVICCPEDGEMSYTLLPLVPGALELQLMTGEVTDEKRAIAQAAERVFLGDGHAFARALPRKPIYRVIPVGASLERQSHVHLYEQANEIIDRHETFCVQSCYCRHEKDLLGERQCSHPKDVCMAFGGAASFLAERGFARPIAKEEAFDRLQMADEAGLVHLTDNAVGKTTFMCNCCGCCCGMLTMATLLKERMSVAAARWICQIDEQACNGCGLCAKRCQMGAIEMNGEKKKDRRAVLHAERCIGCGMCEVACKKTRAIRMVERQRWTAPEASYGDLVLGVALSRLPVPDPILRSMPGRSFFARRINRMIGMDGLEEKVKPS